MSLDALAGAVTGRPLLGLVFAYAVCPYAVLWLAVRLWPRDHPRRAELLAEYDDISVLMRPFWVGDIATRCLLDGLAERVRQVGPTGPALRDPRLRPSAVVELVGMLLAALAAMSVLIRQGSTGGLAGAVFVAFWLVVLSVVTWFRWVSYRRRKSIERRGRDHP